MNPFATEAMAAGYATARPPVHGRILEQVRVRLARHAPFQRGLDVGCGAGVSTRAMAVLAQTCVGLEPAVAMLQWAAKTQPGALFLAGSAEAIPLRNHSVDLITAAGSLNYVDLSAFFSEAVRVLRPGGVIVVYDFAPGRSFTDGEALDAWFRSFCDRYPFPPAEGCPLDGTILAETAVGFFTVEDYPFAIPIPLTPSAYVDYMMTETNVARALRNGARDTDIRSWCAETLAPVWGNLPRNVVFRGYFACVRPA